MDFNRPTISEMASLVNDKVLENKNKAVFSILIYTLLKTFSSVICIIPVLMSYISNTMDKTVTLIACVSVCIVIHVLMGVIHYGLISIFDRLTKKEFVTLGFLFIGFKKDQKRAFLTSIFYSLLLLVFIFLLLFIALIIYFNQDSGREVLNTFSQSQDLSGLNSFIQSLSQIFLVAMIVLEILFFPFEFRYLFLLSDEKISSVKALFKSYAFTLKNLFRYIGLLIYSTKVSLALVIVCNLVSYFIPKELSFLSMLISIVAFIAEINLLVKVNFCNVIFFYSSNKSTVLFNNHHDDENMEKNILLNELPESDGDKDL